MTVKQFLVSIFISIYILYVYQRLVLKKIKKMDETQVQQSYIEIVPDLDISALNTRQLSSNSWDIRYCVFCVYRRVSHFSLGNKTP
jgi:hypothetical protein